MNVKQMNFSYICRLSVYTYSVTVKPVMNDPAMCDHLSFPAIIVMHRSVLLYKCTAMNDHLLNMTNDHDFLAKIAFWYCLERPFLCDSPSLVD